ncbi:bifunctional phosphopantothenoylcysteine decarboxylase/phosphopantothenate--cysteine ligase CoaBC [Macrococcoides caseolyticum subsp. caseolyticum]|uniref:bifunctional phosphopantothenoylcysteine decarboxylase/phosphopantothenate--cysteine ligase CoaBC n=1 Tax=Macrococcoides caseolyticum TaxID=69966 RepID=UPI000CD1E1F8|nr:bifunctional phosphopantothenoylcysteine decarboxylase/phosphopantothenate--cysteine ligase CoaBC [Macrococcus caseolyticus]PNZ74664.1 bifunctional phosphopantothenoylcysteine decarboxylase/phosphopantothenate--cysteine ligase CoaBC [Macrococcus caseolyticus]QPT47401.1 bifunctional phosphopantothenoylcysteine decarboxylase/phosphopantothenate--cysteine ligase CoaBC [Macrococcus caseolyticus]RAK48053.1 bifunctional phosphopantothenoylcysteine decarboxylase/phosphopantothenate--cysteine ligase 
MKIVLGVTGGIAVYKAIDLTSKLVQNGHEVRVIMTESAEQFVTPLAFQALSRNPVYTDIFVEHNPAEIQHIALGDWADIMIIAPLTASTLGKIAHGISDNMLTATVLAFTKTIYLAPAMNSNMYNNPAVIDNIQTLLKRGFKFIEPGEGFLACGYIAKGRMGEPLEIMKFIAEDNIEKDLQGKKVLITAGPTIETIDPVRYLTNRSSGKMGYSLAEAANLRGADVTLVSADVGIPVPNGVRHIKTESAQDMFNAVRDNMEQDLIIKAAAVADYTPVETHDQKLKKQEGDLTITFKRTVDILKYIGEHKTIQFVVGFAAETEHVEKYARGKLIKKNADVIVANNVGDKSIGFKSNDNAVTMYFKDGTHIDISKQSKLNIAHEILSHVKEKGFK